MRVLAFFVTATLLVTGCSHDTLDWRNAQYSGGHFFKAGADKPYTGYITNVPDTALHQWSLDIDRTLMNQAQGMYYTNDGTFCDGYIKDGVGHGEFVCKSGGKPYTHMTFDGEGGWGEGAFQIYDLHFSTDHPLLEGTMHRGFVVGKFTQYAKDGSVAGSWDLPQR